MSKAAVKEEKSKAGPVIVGSQQPSNVGTDDFGKRAYRKMRKNYQEINSIRGKKKIDEI
jgi:hypothetical protein